MTRIYGDVMTSSRMIFSVLIHYIVGHVECAKLHGCRGVSEAIALDVEIRLHSVVRVVVASHPLRVDARAPGLFDGMLQVLADTIVSAQWSGRVEGSIVLYVSDLGFGL